MIYDKYLLSSIPTEIIEAERRVSEFFASRNIPTWALGHSMSRPMIELQNSSYWADKLKVVVIDPDGWNRSNFNASWEERISEVEFKRRLNHSTSVMHPTGAENRT